MGLMDNNSINTLYQFFGILSTLFTILITIASIMYAVRRSNRKKELAEASLAEAQAQKAIIEARKLVAETVDEPNVLNLATSYQRLMDGHITTIQSHVNTINDMELRIRNLESEVIKLWQENTKLRKENVDCSAIISNLEEVNRDLSVKMSSYNQESIGKALDIQGFTYIALSNALQPTTLIFLLEQVLDKILDFSWLGAFKGCIFLIEDDPDILVLRVQRGVSSNNIQVCSKVPIGKCFCGEAAQLKQLMFYSCDDNHHIVYPGMVSHGHYCIPLLNNNILLGLLSLYIESNKQKDKIDERFLKTVGKTISDVIRYRSSLS